MNSIRCYVRMIRSYIYIFFFIKKKKKKKSILMNALCKSLRVRHDLLRGGQVNISSRAIFEIKMNCLHFESIIITKAVALPGDNERVRGDVEIARD
ncbi:hypothetical protein PUN28_019869 [Cardiocondyla obscurior]|uniref:Uncharacterized protein n=1 Tax=Cardiocondyla obscurior TaxID=286306 RepID=A0AAW2E946_9HYME